MKASKPAIALSGAGCVLPSGNGVEAFWQAALDGRSGIGPLRARHFHSRRIAAFGHVDDDVHQACRQAVPGNLQRYCGPPVLWGVAAVRQALAEAGLDPREGGLRFGLYCSQGGYTHPSLDAYAELIQECRQGRGLDAARLARRVLQERALDPFLVLKSLSNGLLGVVSLACKLECECNAYMQGVAGNQAALREACAALQSYRIDAAIVVGAGSELDALALDALARAGVVGTCGAPGFLPFDEDGRGGIAGEGAAALILRRAEDLAEGPQIHLTHLAAAANVADLEWSGSTDLLVCAGTGRPERDRELAELYAGSGAAHVTSSQPLTGLLSGAPGLVDLILARGALLAQQVPPLAGLRRPVSAALPFAVGASRPARLHEATVVGCDDNGFSARYRLARRDTLRPAACA